MRSVIKLADAAGIKRVVDQQFEIAQQIRAWDLMPILEPEIDIYSPQKKEAEVQLRAALREQLGLLGAGHRVMLKLTLPDLDGFYTEFVDDPHVVRVLSRNPGMVASFSRALTEGLSAHQSDEEFEVCPGDSIDSIFRASTATQPLAG